MAELNYAEQWSPKLVEMYIENSYLAPFLASNVEWLNAKTFHFTVMTVGGYKAHTVAGGWNRSEIEQTDVPYTVENDRDTSFFIDKREVDETNKTASMEKISETFTKTQAIPEADAYFFSKVANKAIEENMYSETVLSDWTVDNVVSKLKAIIRKVGRYQNKGLILYVRGEIMDLLSMSTEYQRTIEVSRLSSSEKGLETRIASLDGVILIEVIDFDRFYTAFDFTESYVTTDSSKAINVLGATPLTTKYVDKINSIYLFAPGEHTEGDGALYQNRDLNDVFVFPNGKDGSYDSVYVDYDPTALETE